ncbi:UNVERIFIED_CONTAM: protein BASIC PENTACYSTEINE2 [Sesamum calycinum]|uniref:GAGA-binding transcriptional activator n=1 Tax=Sesamum calycinum TaxID=2727403 RepID=A0AAW2SX14_9LAMI
MDGNGNMNLRNWGFIEPPTTTLKSHLGLQLMSSMAEKPLFGGGGVRDHQHTHPSSVMASTNGGPFHHHRVGGISEAHFPMDYWMNQNRDKYLNVLSGNQHHAYYQSSYGVSPETSSAHSIQMPQQINLPKNDNVISEMEEVCEEEIMVVVVAVVVRWRRREAVVKSQSLPQKRRNRGLGLLGCKGMSLLLQFIAQGLPRNGRKLWGSGGWQSACCTTGLSIYPLPMSTKRRGARIAGRKMSIGAFKKVLEKLASEGYNFSNPIDLRSYWAKHGTNKFVTIR